MGIQTVQRRMAMLEQELNKAVASELGQPVVEFRRVREQRCPVHGPVTIWPCVACAAFESRESRKAR